MLRTTFSIHRQAVNGHAGDTLHISREPADARPARGGTLGNRGVGQAPSVHTKPPKGTGAFKVDIKSQAFYLTPETALPIDRWRVGKFYARG